jgi:hypothetical protein
VEVNPKDLPGMKSSRPARRCAIGYAYPPGTGSLPKDIRPLRLRFSSIMPRSGADVPVAGFAGGGAWYPMNEMSSIGRKEWPGITMVVFRNYQWGAEKRNSILWYDDNFVGTELDPHLSFAKIAKACGLEGVQVKTQAELTAALKEACAAQKNRVTTFIEVILNQEPGQPFRRDAMKKPVVIAGRSQDHGRSRCENGLGAYGESFRVQITGPPLRRPVKEQVFTGAKAVMLQHILPVGRCRISIQHGSPSHLYSPVACWDVTTSRTVGSTAFASEPHPSRSPFIWKAGCASGSGRLLPSALGSVRYRSPEPASGFRASA